MRVVGDGPGWGRLGRVRAMPYRGDNGWRRLRISKVGGRLEGHQLRGPPSLPAPYVFWAMQSSWQVLGCKGAGMARQVKHCV